MASFRSWRFPTALAAIALFVLVGCGASDSDRSGGSDTSSAEPLPVKPISSDRLQDLILRGVGEDFRPHAAGMPRRFGLCVRLGLGRELNRSELKSLVVAVRHAGDPVAAQAEGAQALNALAAPVGDECGGRRHVPKLIAAAAPLVGVRIAEPPARRQGLSYGPYVGVACPRANRIGCDRVGIDFVLRRPAVRASAWIAGRQVRLSTPGLNNGVRGRDWVGYLRNVGLRSGSTPFAIPGSGPHRRWAGDPPVLLPVRIVAVRADGRRLAIELPPVRLSPGWG